LGKLVQVRERDRRRIISREDRIIHRINTEYLGTVLIIYSFYIYLHAKIAIAFFAVK
jgi:hypothetical protein